MVALFGVLTAGLAAIAVAAFDAGQYPIAIGAGALAVWMATLAVGVFRGPQKSSLARGESGTVAPTDVDWFLEGERARGASPATLRSYGADLRTYAAWLEGRASHARRPRRGPTCAPTPPTSPVAASPRPRGPARWPRCARCTAGSTPPDAPRPTRPPSCPGPRRERRLPDAPRESELARLLDERWPDGTRRPARPRDARAAVRLRPARQRGLPPRPRRRRRPRRPRARQGRQGAAGADRRAGRRRRRRVARPRAARGRDRRQRRRAAAEPPRPPHRGDDGPPHPQPPAQRPGARTPLAARAASRLRDPSPGARRRPARNSGTSGACFVSEHGDLHSGLRVAPPFGPRPRAPRS